MVLGDVGVDSGGMMCLDMNMKAFVCHSAARGWAQVCGLDSLASSLLRLRCDACFLCAFISYVCNAVRSLMYAIKHLERIFITGEERLQ